MWYSAKSLRYQAVDLRLVYGLCQQHFDLLIQIRPNGVCDPTSYNNRCTHVQAYIGVLESGRCDACLRFENVKERLNISCYVVFRSITCEECN